MKNLDLIYPLILPFLLLLITSTSSIRLYSVCQRNAHCSLQIANSFCGWSELNDHQTVCMCRDGYKPTENRMGCVARHRCSFTGLNAAQQPGVECPSLRQFCRRSVCLCRLGYDYDHLDHCVPSEDSILLELQSSNGSLPTFLSRSPQSGGRGVNMEVEETINLSFILYIGTVFLVICVILTLFSSITAIIFFRKFHHFKMQLYSSRMTAPTEQKLLV